MDIHEMFGHTAYLHQLYEDKFPELNADMMRVWFEDLKCLDADLAHCAVRRWVRQHTFKAPGIDELLEQAEIIQTEQRQARRSSGRSETSALDVLKDAAEAQSPQPRAIRGGRHVCASYGSTHRAQHWPVAGFPWCLAREDDAGATR